MAVVDGVRLPLAWRDARERIRVARALERSPWCDWVFARGEACLTKVRAVVAVATPENDPRWASAMLCLETSRASVAPISPTR